MSAIVLDGEATAAKIRAQVMQEVEYLKAEGVNPGLGTILVGDNPSSARYVEMKHADCLEVGITSVHRHLSVEAGFKELLDTISEFNHDPKIHAYLVQLPLPSGFDEVAVLLNVDPDKDVDGLHPVNLGKLVMGVSGPYSPLACTPRGILELLKAYAVPIQSRHVVILGRGLTIGRPLALLLSSKRPDCNAAVTVIHTGVRDLGYYTSQADIVIVAVGRAGLITKDMIKPGACVVGAGTSFEGRKLLSDVAEDVSQVAGWVTPRIGGVGPMTRAMLLVNAVEAAKRSQRTSKETNA